MSPARELVVIVNMAEGEQKGNDPSGRVSRVLPNIRRCDGAGHRIFVSMGNRCALLNASLPTHGDQPERYIAWQGSVGDLLQVFDKSKPEDGKSGAYRSMAAAGHMSHPVFAFALATTISSLPQVATTLQCFNAQCQRLISSGAKERAKKI